LKQTHHQELQTALTLLAGLEREALRTHVEECAECAGMLGEVCSAVGLLCPASPRPMDPARSEQVRARLLARAREDAHRRAAARQAESAARARPGVLGAAGWLTAAGLASLLLTHHAFHRPLALGWLAAAGLGIALFGAAAYIFIQRRRAATLRDRVAVLERALAHLRAAAAPGGG
jgi:hypothetical protein